MQQSAPQQPSQPDEALRALNQTDANGLRWTWSTYPNGVRPSSATQGTTPFELPDMIIPLSCMVTPLHHVQDMPVLSGPVLKCKSCGAAISIHSRIDTTAQYWMCRSCLTRNPLPQGYAGHPQSQTVEYVVDQGLSAPTFVFVVDTCAGPDELEALKKQLARCVDWLPSNSLIGFISFGHGVTVWELGFTEMSKCYAIRGSRKYTSTELLTMLNIRDESPVLGRFSVPLETCEFALSAVIEELSTDPFPVSSGTRPQRATGIALEIAITLIESVAAERPADVILFTGGPCTRGPGAVVSDQLAEMMRSHRDFLDGGATHYETASAYYNELSQRMSAAKVCLDVAVGSFDQVGVLELRNCVNHSGGVMICGDTFDHVMFAESFRRFFERLDLRRNATPSAATQFRCGFSATMDVFTSPETHVCGVIGPTAPQTVQQKTALNANRNKATYSIGNPGPNWSVGRLDETLTLTFVFDTDQIAPSPSDAGKQRFFQFVTSYVTPTGEKRVRVTSVIQPIAPTNEARYFITHSAFDQACAATVIARLAVDYLEGHENKWESTKRWVDKLLVTFTRRFGSYTEGKPDTLRLDGSCSLLPSFMFNFRRSEYFLVLNISPDETAFKRHWLMREPTDSCIVMLQPTLDAFASDCPHGRPTVLDSSSLARDNVLVMDAFFNVHIMWGSLCFQWMNAGYQNDPQYEHFKHMLESPERDVQAILAKRFPYPRFSRTDENGSESRHVKNRMNPSTSYNSVAGAQQSDTIMYTDDASVSRFMQSLKLAVVTPDSGRK